jgi:hypothetical protein
MGFQAKTGRKAVLSKARITFKHTRNLRFYAEPMFPGFISAWPRAERRSLRESPRRAFSRPRRKGGTDFRFPD